MTSQQTPSRVKTTVAAIALALGGGLAQADAPDPAAIQDVVDYYFTGADAGPLLTEAKFCLHVPRSGANRYNCEGELNPNTLPQGKAVYVWMNYLVPEGSGTQLLLQVNREGITRDAHSFKVESGIRYRVWKRVRFNRSGEWELPIMLEQAQALTPVATVKAHVGESAAGFTAAAL